MKRLVFCFDGTWNRLEAPNPTNVVITAESITPIAPDGTVQIIHYDSGVGTGRVDHWTGGIFGEGLLDKIMVAYTFLVFNYEPGDEIFVFGFSRGAFSARAFVGFVRSCGIVQRRHAAKIADAARLYQERSLNQDHNTPELLAFRAECSPEICIDMTEDAWRVINVPGYLTGAGTVVRIKYLGVWDTVGAMGIPDELPFAEFINRHRHFYDENLSSLVVSARHAVAIDELRRSFTPTLWPNLAVLNAALGFHDKAVDAPYQQKWFPGVHGSVGGGGDVRGLSDRALDWVLDGARAMGLALDLNAASPLFALAPDDFAPLDNMHLGSGSVLDKVMHEVLPTKPRVGPTAIEDVGSGALRRWREPATNLPGGQAYRPETLSQVADAITAGAPAGKLQIEHSVGFVPVATGAAPAAGTLHTVVYGDTLGGLAHRLYGDAAKARDIMLANPKTIIDENRIYVGQVIMLPDL